MKYLVHIQDITEQKEYEYSLIKKDRLLNDTQKMAGVGGWIWNIKRQTMLWSDETYRILDIESNKFDIGKTKHLNEHLHCYSSYHRKKLLEAFRRCAREGQSFDIIIPFTTRSGRTLT